MTHTLIVYWHVITVLIALVLLLSEHQLFSSPLSVKRGWRLLVTDTGYGFCACLAFASGAALVWYGEGIAHYAGDWALYCKVGLFITLALLSTFPTLTFFNFVPDLRSGRVPEIEPSKARLVLWCIRVELFLLMVMVGISIAGSR